MNSITQDMKYRYSLMKYAEKFEVSRANRKYNRNRSYIYFWQKRFDVCIESLACRSRRPHSHPNQHTEAELKLIRDMRRRNPDLGVVELWARMRKRGYTRCVESLWRVLQREGLAAKEKPRKKYQPKPYEQMQYPGQRIQIDIKVVPRACIADPELRLFQYTAIDEYSRYRILGAYPEQSTYSSADFLHRVVAAFACKGIKVECVQTDNGFEFTNRFSNSKRDLPTLFESAASALGVRHKLIRPYTPRQTVRLNAATAKTRNASMPPIVSTPSPTLVGSSLPTKLAATTTSCDHSTGCPQRKGSLSSLYKIFDKPTYFKAERLLFLSDLQLRLSTYEKPYSNSVLQPERSFLSLAALMGHTLMHW